MKCRLIAKPTKFISVLIIFNFCSGHLKAQSLPVQMVQVVGGFARHGSGDMKGIAFGAEYSKYLSKKISLNYNFRGSINNSTHFILVTDNTSGTVHDRSLRFTTAGLQLGINGRSSLIRNSKHEFLVSLGAFGRYQSASNGSDGYSLYYPATTGIPSVLVEYDNRTPQQTYSVGGILQLQYNFTFIKNYSIGVAPGFQTDTNGDALLQMMLVLGTRI